MGSKRHLTSTAAIAAAVTFACADALSHLVGNAAIFAGLASSLPDANGKFYFEAGLVICELVLIALPDLLERHRRAMAALAAALLGLAMGAIAVFVEYDAFPPALGAGLLLLFGLSFMAVKFCAVLALVRTRSIPLLVMAVLGGKALKAFLVVIAFCLEGAAQSALAACLTAIAMAGAVAAARVPAASGAPGIGPALSSPFLAGQIVLSAVVLACLQAFTPFSVHGAPVSTGAAFIVPYLLSTLAMAGGGYLLLGRRAPSPSTFRNSFLVLLLGLLLSLSWNAGGLDLATIVDAVMTGFFEPFGHGVFWLACVTTCWVRKRRPLRVVGLGMLAFSLIELLWITLLTSLSPTFNLMVALVAYGCIVLAGRLGGDAPAPAHGEGPAAGSPDAADAEPDSASDAHLLALARDRDLSPRETEVFMLLARGRTRRYIQDKLFISDSTVKTHVSRIYRKFDAANKQEFLDRILEKDDGR